MHSSFQLTWGGCVRNFTKWEGRKELALQTDSFRLRTVPTPPPQDPGLLCSMEKPPFSGKGFFWTGEGFGLEETQKPSDPQSVSAEIKALYSSLQQAQLCWGRASPEAAGTKGSEMLLGPRTHTSSWGTHTGSALLIPHRNGKPAAAGTGASCPACPAGEEFATDLSRAASCALLKPLFRTSLQAHTGCFGCPDLASGASSEHHHRPKLNPPLPAT